MIRRLSALLPLVMNVAAAPAGEMVFDTPSDDRWHYPFNFNPGRRAIASCFGSTADPNYTTFNDRDGIFLVAWRTDDQVCTDLPLKSYDIRSIRVTLTGAVCSGCPVADWYVDLTTDPWFNLDYPITDSDLGQPLELFGVGFGPEFTYNNWVETSFFVGGDDLELVSRDPFPFAFAATTGAKVHVEDSVKNQFTPAPWSIGVPFGYVRGNQTVPFPVDFDVNLALSNGRVRGYFQEQLRSGRVFAAITALTVTSVQAPTGFPTFFTKEGLALHPDARAPRLTIDLVPSGDVDGNERRGRADWKEMQSCLDGPDLAPGPGVVLSADGCLCVFDLDEDGDVDLQDVGRFQQRFDGGN